MQESGSLSLIDSLEIESTTMMNFVLPSTITKVIRYKNVTHAGFILWKRDQFLIYNHDILK